MKRKFHWKFVASIIHKGLLKSVGKDYMETDLFQKHFVRKYQFITIETIFGKVPYKEISKRGEGLQQLQEI